MNPQITKVESEYLKTTNYTIDLIEFISKKGTPMCKLVLKRFYNENGVEKLFELSSASYISNNLIDTQFKFKNKAQSSLFKGKTALDCLKMVLQNNSFVNNFILIGDLDDFQRLTIHISL